MTVHTLQNSGPPASATTIAVVVVVAVYVLAVLTIVVAVVRRQQAVRHHNQHAQAQHEFYQHQSDPTDGLFCGSALLGSAQDRDSSHLHGLQRHYKLDSGRATRHQLEAFRALSIYADKISSEDADEISESDQDSYTTSTVDGDADAQVNTIEVLRIRRSETGRVRCPQLRRRAQRGIATAATAVSPSAKGAIRCGGCSVARALRLRQPRLSLKEANSGMMTGAKPIDQEGDRVCAGRILRMQQLDDKLQELSHTSPHTSFGVSLVTSSANPEEEGGEACDRERERIRDDTLGGIATYMGLDEVDADVARADRADNQQQQHHMYTHLSAVLTYEADNEADTYHNKNDSDGDDHCRFHAGALATAFAEVVAVSDAIDVHVLPSYGPKHDTDQRRGGGLLSASHYSCDGPRVSRRRSCEGAEPVSAAGSGSTTPSPTPRPSAFAPTRRHSTSCFHARSPAATSALTLSDERGARSAKDGEADADDGVRSGSCERLCGDGSGSVSASAWCKLPVTRRNSPKYGAGCSLAETPRNTESDAVLNPVHADQALELVARDATSAVGAATKTRREVSGASSLAFTPLTAYLTLAISSHHLMQTEEALTEDGVAPDGSAHPQVAKASVGEVHQEGGAGVSGCWKLSRGARFPTSKRLSQVSDAADFQLLSPSEEGGCEGCDTCAGPVVRLHEDLSVLFSR